jgi:GH18 family chitinase
MKSKIKPRSHVGRLMLISLLFATITLHAQRKVVGYIPTGYSTSSVDFTKITHLNIAFENADASGNLSWTSGNDAFVSTAHANNVKVLVSICGGGASNDATYQSRYTSLMSAANRSSFISKIVSYLSAHNLDGIDLDLEGPAINANYSDFVIALKSSLPAGKLLTAALAHDNGGNVPTPASIQTLDYLNIMAYDFGWGQAVHHSTYNYAVTCINWWMTNKGLPASKVVLGVPFYGYTNTTGNGGISYAQILNTYGVAAAQQDTWVSGGNTIYYNGIPTIRQKTQLVVNNNYGGVMIWQLAQDATGTNSLLYNIDQVIKSGTGGTGVTTVYKDCNYSGYAVALPVGDYTLSQMNAKGILNDDVSSLKVSSGYKVTLYENDNFGGASFVVTADNSCLVGNSWNDRTTSMRVATNGASFSTTIQAESWLNMAGVQTETTTDAGGGLNVGWIDAGDWITYNVTIPTAGTYKVIYRVASPNANTTLRLEKDAGATQLGSVTIPNTGGWQTWANVSHTVTLPAGTYPLGIATSTGGFNINYFTITNNLSARMSDELELISDEIELVLSPNPVADQLYINGMKEIKRVKVYDLQGREEISVVNPGNNVSVQSLTQGLHVVVVENKDGLTRMKKFIKQ